MSKILYVVHRAYPYPGGSEFFTHDMAKECVKRKHQVTTLAQDIKLEECDGIKFTDNYNLLLQEWDLIVVHGSDVVSQNIVHANAYSIKSPVLYMIIKPSDSLYSRNGIKFHNYLGYSTTADIEHLNNYNVSQKLRRVRHGIDPKNTIAKKNKFRKKYDITTKKLVVSAGGFYPHKGFDSLIIPFNKNEVPDTTLCLFGYGMEENAPDETENIKVFKGFDKWVIMEAIADADLYVMNSYEEGFGLVLLEAMMNKTPWAARDIAGAHDMKDYGIVYQDENELEKILNDIPNVDVDYNFNYAMTNHNIKNTVDDIEDIINGH
ncbi:MAG: glycosyltransferase family 4 protein [Candidatus Paceibacterota bacterium]